MEHTTTELLNYVMHKSRKVVEVGGFLFLLFLFLDNGKCTFTSQIKPEWPVMLQNECPPSLTSL